MKVTIRNANKKGKLVSEVLGFVRWPGEIRFKSGTYTSWLGSHSHFSSDRINFKLFSNIPVGAASSRDLHFEADRNAASGQKMKFMKPVLAVLEVVVGRISGQAGIFNRYPDGEVI